ncbi:MAG: hypothetical protein R3E76_01140 [Planctomycetota bacterium]
MGLFSVKFVTASSEASRTIHESCTHCGTAYVYTATRKGRGVAAYILSRASGMERAEERAYNHTERLLDNAADPVRCPACQGFDPLAIRQFRFNRTRQTLGYGLVGVSLALLLSAIVCAVWMPTSAMTVLSAVDAAGVGIVAVAAIGWWVVFDPAKGRNFLRGVDPEMLDGAILLEAHNLMIDARREVHEIELEEAPKRRERDEARRTELRRAAESRKQAEMQKMAERAKRSIGS